MIFFIEEDLKGIPKLKTNIWLQKRSIIIRYLVVTKKNIPFFSHRVLPVFISEKSALQVKEKCVGGVKEKCIDLFSFSAKYHIFI